MSGSDSDVDINNLTEKERQEIERRRKKNKKKKESKKQRKQRRNGEEPEEVSVVKVEDETPTEAEAGDTAREARQSESATDSGVESSATTDAAGDVELKDVRIEYVGEKPQLDESDPNYSYFTRIFEAFKVKTEEEIKREEEYNKYYRKGNETDMDSISKAAISERILQEEMSERRKEQEEAGELQKLSRRKLRISLQPSIADLKANTARPDVVEWADVTSRDPHLLVELKAYRNTVPVPRHWNAKRKYLAGKRGFERAPFELPDFIKRTGIMEMRETMWEKESNQSLKSMMRERVRPKMGRIDIDYQKLHDAFFKWQTKPQMTKMGELYYEGKELEAQMKDKKPGNLSDELRIALGMPVGPNAHKFPPPWLIAMQRYGPPPSYPNLKIPGLNCPIPEGCAFGYHAGGWGKPPVDEYGKPLYGDVPNVHDAEDESRIDRRHWGEIGSDEEESDEESEEEEEEEEDQPNVVPPPESGFTTPAVTEGFATPSGITTVPGVETPEIELRKKKAADDSLAGTDTPQALYHVIPEKKVERIGSQMMASTHVYDLSKKQGRADDGIEVSLNPEDLDLSDQRGLERKYEEQLRKQSYNRLENEEDFSDMVAEHAAKQNASINRKRKAQEDREKKTKSTSGSKKYKDFKF
ncbi:splicing factor 3b [Aphelenchoides avenae]|nr:splicing factor 3b [Aphelenchus avenae]